MLYLLGKAYYHTFLRLFSSHIVLISIGSFLAAILIWKILPLLWNRLPRDRGKSLVPDGAKSAGKPTGAGLIISTVILPVLLLVIPPDFSILSAIAALYLIMLFGYLDDKAVIPWGERKKAITDLIPCILAAGALYFSGANEIWLPFTSRTFMVPWWLYFPIAILILVIALNSLNCTDGVDGLATSLGIISLLSISALLYLVLGYKPVAQFLLLPHYPDSAKWAILSTTICGGFAGYLWHNCEPSSVLMGDAGSRFLGLAIGIAVLATGNPFLFFVFAPVIFVNGGVGIVKTILLRGFKRLGFDTTITKTLPPELAAKQSFIVRCLHSVRFPLHDHFKHNKKWSNAQVLMRMILVQLVLIPILFALFTKVR